MKGQSLYDWCIENGEWGQQLLFEFGDGNNSQQFTDEETGMIKGPMDFSRGGRTKIPWTCKEGHKWITRIGIRACTKTGCPYCAGQRVSNENSLRAWCENNGERGQQLIDEWVGLDENENHITMDEVTSGSGKKLQWKCKEGHTWLAMINNRTRKEQPTNCPYCVGQRASDGNSFATWCKTNGEYGQRLIAEWTGLDENKNTIEIDDVTSMSNKKVYWKCREGHIWLSVIYSRTRKEQSYGCPYCSGNKVSDKNSLKIWCKEYGEYGKQIFQEWVGLDENNNTVNINEIARASGKKVQWKCKDGHTWITTVASRTIGKCGCPYCSTIGTSYPEQFLYKALLQIYPNTISRGKFQGIEYDIGIPEEKTCIEYSGINWHADKLERDEMKANLCNSHGVIFIQIYAHNGEIDSEDIFEDNLIIYNASLNKDLHDMQLTKILNNILKQFGHSISEIDIEKAQTEAFNFMHNIESEDR